MKRYLIEDAKSGVKGEGTNTDCCFGSIVAAVKFSADGESIWIYSIEEVGVPSFYLSEDDLFDELVQDNPENEEFHKNMSINCSINEFEGIELDDYDAALESIDDNIENPAGQLIRLLIALTRLEQEESDELAEEAIGKYADEVAIPEFDFEN